VHQTILIGAAVALRPLALPAGPEAATIVLLTFGGGFAAWRLARRSGGLRPWLGLAARDASPVLRPAAATSA
jgi:glucans biosynthesis protein C